MSPRILVDGVFFQIGRSGIARVWTQVFQQWLQDGSAEHVTVIDRGHSLPRLPGLKVIDAPPFHYGDLQADREAMQRLCNAVQADVFVSTYYTQPLHTPTLMLVHDMIPEVLRWDLQEPMWQQKQMALAQADAFVTVSTHTAHDLRQHLLTHFPLQAARPIEVCHNGCDLQPATADAIAALRERLGVQRPYFLLSGTRSDYKNARLFFQALSLLGEARAQYSVLCTGGGELEADFQQLAGPAQVCVTILSDADMAAAYSGAVALVYPSLYEGFGLPVLEAMACGCPVISTQVASLPEVGGNAPLYLDLNEHVASQLTSHMRLIQTEPERSTRMALGRQQAQAFSWTRQAQGLMRALRHLAHDKPSRLSPTDQLVPQKGHAMALPADHLLTHYQAQHRLYDRFLPFLAQGLPSGSVVVDVGANCGDTLAAMFDVRPDLGYVCVEPDPIFHRYLRHNTQAMQAAHPEAQIHLVQALVGKSVTQAVLTGGGGSKRAEQWTEGQDTAGAQVHQSLSLDAIADQVLGDQQGRVRLLKSDVDGYDHDVLASASGLMAKTKPLLFFECQVMNEAQLLAYKRCLSGLCEQGYCHFAVFDNYGNPMLTLSEIAPLHQLLDYIWRQASHGVTRSMYYVDILAAQADDASLADEAVNRYVKATCA